MILAEKEECGDEIVLMPQIQGVPSVQRRIGMWYWEEWMSLRAGSTIWDCTGEQARDCSAPAWDGPGCHSDTTRWKGKGNAKIFQLVEVLPMEIGKSAVISELFESNLFNLAYRGAFPETLTPAWLSPRHCECSQGFPTQVIPPAVLQVSPELVMMDTVSRVESIMALYSGFAQFVENEVPSLARSFFKGLGQKVNESSSHLLFLQRKFRGALQSLRHSQRSILSPSTPGRE